MIDSLIKNMKYSVQVVILKDDKVLSVSRKDDHNDFGLIGGKVDPTDVQIADAAVRETKEETGLIVNWFDLYPVFQIHKDNYMSHTFLCTSYSGEIHTDEPHVVKWVDWSVIEEGSFGEYNKLVHQSLISMGVLNK
jgi:ADP-ribose pyrophosphatase YjhB (NUDIX family)